MSKMKELDLIAQGVADHMKELLYDTVEWQIADQPVNGDDFNEMHSYVMDKAIEKMAMELPEFRRLNIGDYKQNTITTG
ncbi:MAG: hypothetical protein GY920_04500 [Aliivibrio sp.]|nr:hypothetical protein [Aliivibrio sp.]